MSLTIFTNTIGLDSFSYELSKYPDSVILTISSKIEDEKTKLGRFDASISFRNKKEYYYDYIGHSHSIKTPALYGILLGMAKLKRPVSVVVFMDISVYTTKTKKDMEVYNQIEKMAEKKEVKSLTIIGIQDGKNLMETLSKEPEKKRRR